jgi:cell division control protein 7
LFVFHFSLGVVLISYLAVDVWSVGVILLCVLSGRYPFFKAVDDNMAIMQLVSLFGVKPMQKTAEKYGKKN